MSRLKLNITMSLDGYVAGPDQSTQHPLGIGGEQLHDWLVPLRAFRERHGALTVAGLADHADVWRARQRQPQAFAHDLVIVDDQTGDLVCAQPAREDRILPF